MDSIVLNSFSAPVKIPQDSGTKEINIDLTEAVRQIALLGKDTDETEPFAHVERFRDWFSLQYGIQLGLGQADELMDRLEQAYVDAKKKRSWRQSLPSSMASTPSS